MIILFARDGPRSSEFASIRDHSWEAESTSNRASVRAVFEHCSETASEKIRSVAWLYRGIQDKTAWVFDSYFTFPSA
jgi:hypothetical protein